MTTYEYKVVPSPTRGRKAKGVRGPEARFANAVEHHMNDLAAEGWEFLRAETLPSDERGTLGGVTTTFRTVMVFRRPRPDDPSEFEPRLIETPVPAELPAPADTESPEEDAERRENAQTPISSANA